MTNADEKTPDETYAFEAERRHQLALPLTLAAEGFGLEGPAQEAFEQLLLRLAGSEVRPFAGCQRGKLVNPDGPATLVFVLDVFDRPLYLLLYLLPDDTTVVQLQAPVLSGLEASEAALVLDDLETFVPDLGFVVAPGRTLVAGQELSLEAFTTDALALLTGFCNRVREAASYVRDHRTRGLPEAVPPEVRAFFGL